jgi:hypothetical protein
MNSQRDALIQVAKGFNTGNLTAKQYVDQLLGVASASQKVSDTPANVKVTANTAGASSQLNGIESALQRIDGTTANASVIIQTIKSGTSSASGHAEGGYISGPGTPTSDSIPAWLSNGEYVLKAAAVRAIGVGQLNSLNARGYANGGYAGITTNTNTSTVQKQGIVNFNGPVMVGPAGVATQKFLNRQAQRAVDMAAS